MRGRTPALILSAALMAGGLSVAQASAASPDSVAIARGAEVAQGRCANCHAVALETRSPEKDAPQFRVLSRLYSAEVLARKLYDFSENGHFNMPPVALRVEDIADVSAYIASLDGGATEMPRRRGDPVAAVGRPARRKGRAP